MTSLNARRSWVTAVLACLLVANSAIAQGTTPAAQPAQPAAKAAKPPRVPLLVEQRAIDLIKALGCTYKIIAPDGQEYGDLKVLVPKTGKAGKRAPRKPLMIAVGLLICGIASWELSKAFF